MGGMLYKVINPTPQVSGIRAAPGMVGREKPRPSSWKKRALVFLIELVGGGPHPRRKGGGMEGV